jgi:uncharacterized membrane protein required for colicin V production
MGIVFDIILIAFIIIGTISGIKKGLIKSLVGFVGLVAILILSYSLRIPLANFLIDKMPFFKFSGAIAGLTSLNILLYNVLAFIVIFIVLYCVLSIIMTITGFIDTLLKFTVIWIIPSKIGGAIVGFLESWVFIFIVMFVLSQFNLSTFLVSKSYVANFVLDHTPVIGSYMGGARKAAKDIYERVNLAVKDKNKTTKELNVEILGIEVSYKLITKEKANELMETGKLGIEDVLIGKGLKKWLNV